MKHRFVTITGLALLIAVRGAWSEEAVPLPEPLTLADALQVARARNPVLRIARHEIEVASVSARQARLWPNPQLELSAEDVPANDINLSRSENTIGLSQTIPFPGKLRRDRHVANQSISVAEWETARQETELVRDVTVAFARAVVAERRAVRLDDLAALAETMATATAQRVQRGAAPDQEQLRAELEHERARIDRASAQRDRQQTRHTLAMLIGSDTDTLPALGRGLREEIDPSILGSPDDQAATAAHPAARVAQARLDRATAADRRARLEPWPDFTVGVAAGRNEATDEDLVELNVSIPLPIFDRGQARRQETRARVQAATAATEAVDQQLRETFLTTRARVITAHDQVTAYRQRMLPKAEEALRLVRAGFEAGKLGFADLVDTQRTTTQVHLDYLDRLLELNLALAEWQAMTAHTNQ